MRVLHLSKYDSRGGAAIAALNSVRAQRAAGLDARLAVGLKLVEEDFIYGPSFTGKIRAAAAFAAERLPFRLLGTPRHDVRSIGLLGVDVLALVDQHDPDVIVLHNIDGLVALQTLPRIDRPLIWRMHDMWPALGSRHYQTGDPLGPLGAAIDRWVYRRKLRTYRRIGDMTLCPPSKWLAGVARKSLLTGDWPCEVIPNGADLGTFVPDPRRASREMLGFPDNARVIAFGASGGVDDPRKGGILLAAALRAGADRLRASNVQLLVFGGDAGMFSGLGVPIVAREHIRSRSDMAQIYQAADLVVVPSRMENLSLTVLEAMACAAPVLAFRIGGMPDMIDDGYTGWLAPELGSPSLLEALERALAQIAQDPQFGARARAEVVRRFSLPGEAAAMERLFEGILENKRRRGG